jgi:hypothetical protein
MSSSSSSSTPHAKAAGTPFILLDAAVFLAKNNWPMHPLDMTLETGDADSSEVVVFNSMMIVLKVKLGELQETHLKMQSLLRELQAMNSDRRKLCIAQHLQDPLKTCINAAARSLISMNDVCKVVRSFPNRVLKSYKRKMTLLREYLHHVWQNIQSSSAAHRRMLALVDAEPEMAAAIVAAMRPENGYAMPTMVGVVGSSS